MLSRPLVVLASFAVIVAACSSTDGQSADSSPLSTTNATPAGSTPSTSPTTATDPAPTDTTGAVAPTSSIPTVEWDATISPGVEQVTVTGAERGIVVHALPDDGSVEEYLADDLITSTVPPSGSVDRFGSLVLRRLRAGQAYRLVVNHDAVSEPFTPLARDAHPSGAFYAEQRLPAPGFGYVETRDGTTLSANVVLPGPVEDGPYPTVVEYSGYTPSDPEAAGFKDLFPALGYAYVGVNMRGSGCSGGSFRFFEYAQSTDGYDVIETVAAQPWSANVGMVGVSYPGISQLFVAQTRPPSLAAITPLSVIDDSYRSTLYPGGILNTGFAVEWTQDRLDDAQPAVDPSGALTGDGQGWAGARIAAGDDVCAANQAVRLQSPDLVAEIRDTPFYDHVLGDDLAPRTFVDRVEVPTFLAGAWQDEQTGARFATMIPEFTGTDQLFVSLVNGLHTESISPGILPRYLEFLDLYVAERVPALQTAAALSPILAGGLYGTTDVGAQLGNFEDRFAGTTYDEARAAFEAEPPIRVLFEQGAASGAEPLAPLPRFTAEFGTWPVEGTTPTRWFVTGDGAMSATRPPTAPPVSYRALPDGVPATFHADGGSGTWRTDVVWDWREPAPGTAVAFVSPPLDDTTTMIGPASADLWITSNLLDTDLEVTISEVRPNGDEVYVQSGWLRASHRALDPDLSTELRPVHTHRPDDIALLPDPTDGSGNVRTGDDSIFELARVEVLPFAHVFRVGSRIRISIDAPGGNRARWVFETISGGEQVQIGVGGDIASSVVFPVVPGIEVPADPPACDSLRGQPCRRPG